MNLMKSINESQGGHGDVKQSRDIRKYFGFAGLQAAVEELFELHRLIGQASVVLSFGGIIVVAKLLVMLLVCAAHVLGNGHRCCT